MNYWEAWKKFIALATKNKMTEAHALEVLTYAQSLHLLALKRRDDAAWTSADDDQRKRFDRRVRAIVGLYEGWRIVTGDDPQRFVVKVIIPGHQGLFDGWVHVPTPNWEG